MLAGAEVLLRCEAPVANGAPAALITCKGTRVPPVDLGLALRPEHCIVVTDNDRHFTMQVSLAATAGLPSPLRAETAFGTPLR